MKTFPIDFYSGLIPGQTVYSSSTKRTLPADCTRITRIEAAVSTFPNLHVDTWLSLDTPKGKSDLDIFGMLKTGARGGANTTFDVEIPVTSPNLYLNFWSHCMYFGSYDWHCGYILWYE